MNKMKMNFLELFKKYSVWLLVVVIIAACKDDEPEKKNEPGESEVTLNGGPYSNVTAKTTDSDDAAAVYNAQEDATSITYTATVSGREFSVIVVFPGAQKGNHSWNEDNCFVQVVEDVSNTSEAITASYYSPDNSEVHSGTVNVDNYGNVGGVVSGTFEGGATFIEHSTGNITTGTMKGKFSARRIY